MFGEKIRKLREAKGLVQRQVAAELQVDTAYVSKIESNDKPANRNHLIKLASLFNVEEEELISIWLADKVYGVLKDEDVALEAMKLVMGKLMTNQKIK